MLSFSFSQYTKSDADPHDNVLLKELPQTERVAQIVAKYIRRKHPQTSTYADALGVVDVVLKENEDVMAAVIVADKGKFQVYFRKTPSNTTNEDYLTQMEDKKNRTGNKNATLFIKII